MYREIGPGEIIWYNKYKNTVGKYKVPPGILFDVTGGGLRERSNQLLFILRKHKMYVTSGEKCISTIMKPLFFFGVNEVYISDDLRTVISFDYKEYIYIASHIGTKEFQSDIIKLANTVYTYEYECKKQLERISRCI